MSLGVNNENRSPQAFLEYGRPHTIDSQVRASVLYLGAKERG